MPNWSRDPEADLADWLEDQSIYDDEVSGRAWERAFRASPHRSLHWPDQPGLDRRLHPVEGVTDDDPDTGSVRESRVKDHPNAPD